VSEDSNNWRPVTYTGNDKSKTHRQFYHVGTTFNVRRDLINTAGSNGWLESSSWRGWKMLFYVVEKSDEWDVEGICVIKR
jgi:hypothetical protein